MRRLSVLNTVVFVVFVEYHGIIFSVNQRYIRPWDSISGRLRNSEVGLQVLDPRTQYIEEALNQNWLRWFGHVLRMTTEEPHQHQQLQSPQKGVD